MQTHVINGELVAPLSDQYIDIINPSTGEMAGRGADGDAADVDIAVAAAKQAFTTWKETSTSERAAIISRMGLVLGANLEELVALEASCTGLSTARLMSFDIPGVMQFFQTFAENLEDYAFVEYPPVRTIPEAYDVKIVKQPLGVCGLIPAWNGPLFLAFVKLLPAIAAGNTVVIKPAETASLAVVRAVELLQDVVPPGVINVVTGYGHTAGAALAAHPDVAKISFTGSTRTGSLIQKMAADTMKRVTLELGGKGPGIALPDAPVELTARGATVAFLLGSGQICVSGTRLFLHDSIHDEVVARMVELAGALRGGQPFDAADHPGSHGLQGALRARAGLYGTGTVRGRDPGLWRWATGRARV